MKTNLIWVVLLSFFITLVSCEKNDSSPADDSLESEENLTDFALLAASSSTARLSDSTTNTNGGKKCNLTELELSELPTEVTTYITTNFQSATIERAGKTSQREFIVHIKKEDGSLAALLFDAEGNFVSERTHEGKHGTPVAIADLPESITSYINSQYSGATIEKAIQDTEGTYIVAIKKSDGTFAGISFDASGTFKNELTLTGGFGRKSHRGRH